MAAYDCACRSNGPTSCCSGRIRTADRFFNLLSGDSTYMPLVRGADPTRRIVLHQTYSLMIDTHGVIIRK